MLFNCQLHTMSDTNAKEEHLEKTKKRGTAFTCAQADTILVRHICCACSCWHEVTRKYNIRHPRTCEGTLSDELNVANCSAFKLCKKAHVVRPGIVNKPACFPLSFFCRTRVLMPNVIWVLTLWQLDRHVVLDQQMIGI